MSRKRSLLADAIPSQHRGQLHSAYRADGGGYKNPHRASLHCTFTTPTRLSMNNRVHYPLRTRKELHTPQKTRHRGPDSGVALCGTSADMEWTNPVSVKFNEKDVMQSLNDRLTGFIEKVHQLEHQNHALEREIEELRGRSKSASCLEEEYGPELVKLRQLVQDITHQKHQIDIEHENLDEELSTLRRRYEQEVRSRSDTESKISVLKQDVSDAYHAKLHLDKKAQSLVDEIHFLKSSHETQVTEILDQIQEAQVTVKEHEFGDPGVTAALRDIRAQMEGHTASDVQQIGETFLSQVARLTEVVESKRKGLKATQQEIQQYRKSLQAKNTELDCAKGTREALERQLHDVEDRHKEEILHYQVMCFFHIIIKPCAVFECTINKCYLLCPRTQSKNLKMSS